MTRTKLKHAIAEAERFLKRAKALEKIMHKEGSDNGVHWSTCGKLETTAVKRSSMDLTRALADLRRAE